jgi:hypothetical protein
VFNQCVQPVSANIVIPNFNSLINKGGKTKCGVNSFNSHETEKASSTESGASSGLDDAAAVVACNRARVLLNKSRQPVE